MPPTMQVGVNGLLKRMNDMAIDKAFLMDVTATAVHAPKQMMTKESNGENIMS